LIVAKNDVFVLTERFRTHYCGLSMGNQAGIHKEALEAIEKVKKSRNTSLSLRKLGLADVPRAVYESGWIQSLDLSSNKLLSLPEGLFSK
jgi:hypothetical protein